jgi:hypothetical protein
MKALYNKSCKFFYGVILGLLLGSGFIFYSFKNVNDNQKDYIIMQTSELSFGQNKPVLNITYGDGRIETIPLQKPTTDNLFINRPTIIQTMAKIRLNGYKLISTNNIAESSTFFFFFEKE